MTASNCTIQFYINSKAEIQICTSVKDSKKYLIVEQLNFKIKTSVDKKTNKVIEKTTERLNIKLEEVVDIVKQLIAILEADTKVANAEAEARLKEARARARAEALEKAKAEAEALEKELDEAEAEAEANEEAEARAEMLLDKVIKANKKVNALEEAEAE